MSIISDVGRNANLCIRRVSRVQFLPFLIINLGAQVRQGRDIGIWFSIIFQSFIQPMSVKEKRNNQKHLRFSPRHVPSKKQNELSSWVWAFSRIITSNSLSIRQTTVQHADSCHVMIIILLEFPFIFI